MPRNKRPAAVKRWIPLFAFFVVFGVSAAGYLTIARTEERDSFCASCHSQPETTYFERSQAVTATDLASFHRAKSTRCIDCHSGPTVIGRVSAMGLGATDLFAYLAGTAQQPAPLKVPITDGNCLKCHADTARTQDFNRHFHAFLSKWQAIDNSAATCVACHSAHTTDGNATISFLQEQRATAVCQRCHQAVGAGG